VESTCAIIGPTYCASTQLQQVLVDVDHIWQNENFQCRNPTLAKCGGEAQHLEKLGFEVLQDSRMFRARQQGAKHLALRCSWCHWKGLET
jgi:hypothetical protein